MMLRLWRLSIPSLVDGGGRLERDGGESGD